MIDSHAHLDLLEDAGSALERAAAAGVDRVVTIGDDVATSEAAAALAAAHANVWCSAGLHPHHASQGSAQTLQRIEELAAGDRCVAVGEAGLDYYYDHSPREDQRRVFAAQIAMAKRAGRALVVHTRDSWEDTFSILDAEGAPERTVFHCWTGGPREAERALAIGAFLSFSGIVTFGNAAGIRDAAALTPLDRMLVETDAPFLAPVPVRGKRNEPAYVVHVAAALGRLKEVTPEEIARVCTENAERLFRL